MIATDKEPIRDPGMKRSIGGLTHSCAIAVAYAVPRQKIKSPDVTARWRPDYDGAWAGYHLVKAFVVSRIGDNIQFEPSDHPSLTIRWSFGT